MPTFLAGNKRALQPLRARAQAGVTLIELVVVLILLSLLAGMVVPWVGRWLDKWTLFRAGERVAQSIRYARSRAVFEQRYYMVELRGNRVRILEPTADFLREYELPSGVEWGEEIGNPATAPVRVLLSPSGAVEEKTVWLWNNQGSRLRVHVDFLLGSRGVEVAREGVS